MRRLALASVFLMVLGVAAAAQAQVCGDANGDGEVTDTDGVQVLRAAALLSSVCTDVACDVNGDGQITDTDGVLTLRKAALLPIEENCPGATGGTVDSVSEDILPFFRILVPEFPGIAPAAAGMSVETEDCPEGGTRTKRDLIVQLQVQYDACRISDPILGSFEFDGNVALNLALPQVSVNVDVTDLGTGRLVHFEGPIDPDFQGDNIVFTGGPVVISTPQGDFDMFFEDLTFNQDGEPISGSGTIEDNDDNFALDVIEFIANGGGTATLIATFDDLTEQTFTLNLLTGALTPVG